MNPLQVIIDGLAHADPDVIVNIRRPRSFLDTWSLELSKNERFVIVTHEKDRGFIVRRVGHCDTGLVFGAQDALTFVRKTLDDNTPTIQRQYGR